MSRYYGMTDEPADPLDGIRDRMATFEQLVTKLSNLAEEQTLQTKILSCKAEKEGALEFNRTAGSRTASLKAVPKLVDAWMLDTSNSGLLAYKPGQFPKTISDLQRLKVEPQKLSALLTFYGTQVFIAGPDMMATEIDVKLGENVRKYSDECLQEFCREIGVDYKRWFG